MAVAGEGDDSGSKPPSAILSLDDADDDLSPALADKRRIRYIDDEELPNYRPNVEFGLPLTRQRSAAWAYSIHSLTSVQSRSRTVDLAVALPIQYRTVSFSISYSQERRLTDVHDKEEKALKGRRRG